MSEKHYLPDSGYIIVYTGKGKGKTTAALGLAVRAIGYGWRICMIQFIKGSWQYGEIEGVKRLSPNFELNVAGEGFVGILNDKKKRSVHKLAAKKALELSRKKITSGEYQIVILDEINYALSLDLIDVDDVLDIIKNKPKHVSIVLTGSEADKRIIKIADLVTEMKSVKHPFQKGILSIKGIDF